MKIPRYVDVAWGWLEGHFAALTAAAVLAAASVAAMWRPPLAGFILGLALGGLFVHLRLSGRLARARADVDDLLREIGALRHRNNVLAGGVIAQGADLTRKLVAIPEEVDPADDRQKTLPLQGHGEGSGGAGTAESVYDGN